MNLISHEKDLSEEPEKLIVLFVIFLILTFFLQLTLEHNVITSFKEPKKNLIFLTNFSRVATQSLFHFFSRLQNIFLIIVYLTHLSFSPTYIATYSSFWIFSLFLVLLKDFLLNYQSISNYRTMNSHLVKKLDSKTQPSVFFLVQTSEIEAGSIVLLNEGEVVPADLLLLDSSEIRNKEAICYIDLAYVTGRDMQAKKACFSTTKCSKTPNLSLKLEYFRYEMQKEGFKGYLKLLNDPKIERLGEENFIPRGAKIRKSKWMLGLAVFVGSETQIMMNMKTVKLYKSSFLDNLAQIYFGTVCAVMILCACIGEIMFYSTNLTQPTIIDNKSLNHFLMLVPMFPLDFFIAIETFSFVYKYYLQDKISKKIRPLIDPKHDNYNKNMLNSWNYSNEPTFFINQPHLLNELAHLDYMVFGKSGTLTKSNLSIQILYNACTHKVYDLGDYDRFCQLLYETSLHRNIVKTMNFPNELDHKHAFTELKITDGANLIEDFFSTEESNGFIDILEAFVISNDVKYDYSIVDRARVIESKDYQEKALLEFAKGFQFEILNKHPDEDHNVLSVYIVRIKKHIFEYKILGVCHEELEIGNCFSVVYFDPRTKTNFLLMKARVSILRRLLKQENKQKEDEFNRLLLIFSKKGCLDPLMFAKKSLREEEATEFAEKYRNLQSSLISQQNNVLELFASISFDLDLVCFVGINEDLQKHAIDLVNSLKSLNITCWMFTGDNKYNAYNVAHRIKLFEEKTEIYWIESENKQQLVKNIKIILSNLSKEIKPFTNDINSKSQNGFTKSKKLISLKTMIDENVVRKLLLVSGKSLDLILNDEYLCPHFLFICRFMSSVVGFGFSAQNKMLLVKLIKQKYGHKMTVLAIGGSYNDVPMMSSSDVSIEVIHNKEDSMLAGDIVVSRLDVISHLIMEFSWCFFQKYQRVIELAYYKSFLFGFGLFLYALFDEFYSNCLYDPLITLFYNTIFTLPSQIICIFFSHKFSHEFQSKFNLIYKECAMLKKRHFLSKSIFINLVESFTVSVTVSIFTFFSSQLLIGPNGQTSSYNNLGLIMVVSFSTIVNIKVISEISLEINRLWLKNMIKSLLVFLQLSFSIGFLLVTGLKGLVISENFREEIIDFFMKPQLIMIIVMNVWLGFLISFLIRWIQTNSIIFMTSLYDKVKAQTAKITSRKLLILTIKKMASRKRKLTNLIMRLFKKPKIMDVFISYGPYDASVHSFNLNKLSLAFSDLRLYRLYYSQEAIFMINRSRVYILILLITFSIYVIIKMVLNPDSRIVNDIVYITYGVATLVLSTNKKYANLHYKFLNWGIGMVLGLKILFDWIFVGIDISMTAVITVLLIGLTINIRVGFHLILTFVVVFLLSYSMEIIFLFEDVNSELNMTEHSSLNEKQLEMIRFAVSFSLILSICFLAGVILSTTYFFEKQKRLDFIIGNKLILESKLVKDILSMLVPKFIKNSLVEENNRLNEKHEVSILFCDISNFDAIISKEQAEVVQILDATYRYFDDLCFSFGVQKIETVGKTYMACTGIKICEESVPTQILSVNKTSRLVNMAMEMMRFSETFTTFKGIKLHLKIGIHQGEVIAGVIGDHKPQFSLIGDTVNTTSRVCSTGESGQITLSEEAAKNISVGTFQTVKRTVDAKGKGTLTVFQVKKRSTKTCFKFQKLVRLIIEEKKRKMEANKPKLPQGKAIKNVIQIMTGFTRSCSNSNSKHTLIIDEKTHQTKMRKKENVRTLNVEAAMPEEQGKRAITFIEPLSNSKSKSEEGQKRKMNFSKPLSNLLFFENMPLKVKRHEVKKIKPVQPKKKVSLFLDPRTFFKKSNRSSDDNSFKPIISGTLRSANSPSLKDIRRISLIPEKNSLVFLGQPKHEFSKQLFLKHARIEKTISLVLIFFLAIEGFITLALKDFFANNWFFSFKVCFVLMVGIMRLFMTEFYEKLSERRFLRFIVVGIFGVGFVGYFLEIAEASIGYIYIPAMVNVMILWIVMTNFCFFSFKDVFFLSISLLIFWIYMLIITELITNFNNLIYPVIIILLNGFKVYVNSQNSIKNFNNLKTNELKRKQIEHFAYEKLKQIENNNKIDLTDSCSNVTILFADIVNFTKYSSSVTAADVVNMLRELFTEFDKMCQKHQVYKVYTIGDCYVVMGFVNALNRNPKKEALNVVRMGLAMIKIIKDVRKKVAFEELDMRIGVHTGDIIGGIVGKDIVRYDIYGKDVMIANKMESNGLMGHVMVSQNTKNMIESEDNTVFEFKKYKDVELKINEKTITGYLVEQ